MPFRLHEYHTLTALALAGEAAQTKTKPPRIRSTLVLLSGREKPWPEEGEYRTSPETASFSGVTFRIEAVYQRTVAELTARGLLWSIFAPLAVDANAERMKAVLERLRSEMPADFEKRLGRPLTGEQRGTLFRRLGTLGFDRLADIRDDLSTDALAA